MSKCIEWLFQPARTLHFGGAHEALVKSSKRALYRALENEKKSWRFPTEDTPRTVLFKVAGRLNSRPLTYVSLDPADFRPICPNDFLNKPPMADVPAGSYEDADPHECYRYVQRTFNIFWDQWKAVYFRSLVTRKKWNRAQPNFAACDVVMILEKGFVRGQWSIGHIVDVFPGADGLVRVAHVQLPTEIFRRGISQLCLLEPISAAPPVPEEPASGEDVPAMPILLMKIYFPPSVVALVATLPLAPNNYHLSPSIISIVVCYYHMFDRSWNRLALSFTLLAPKGAHPLVLVIIYCNFTPSIVFHVLTVFLFVW